MAISRRRNQNLGGVDTLAATGTVIGNAAAITKRLTVVTGADDAKGVILPDSAYPGDIYRIYSSTATNGLLVYPPVNSDLNDGTANAAITMEGKTMGTFIKLDSTTWSATYTANS